MRAAPWRATLPILFRAFLSCGLACGLAGCLGKDGKHSRVVTDSRAPKTIYEIFTRSFQDSNGDGIGDLDGITSRLDYLSELGVDAIWLTPPYPSPSYHGYDITDYEQVKSDYGDLSSLRRLLSAAHERGIRVLLDIAVNHTSIQHPWFQQDTKDHSLYLWSPEPLNWPLGQGKWNPLDGQYYYSSFSSGMPDLNWRNPEVLSRIEKVFEFWTSLGIDGFRLDAAKFLVKGPNGEANTPETHQIWKNILANTRKAAPNTYFVGEVWDTARNIATYYGEGDELDSAFDFPVMGGLRSSLKSGNADAFAQALAQRIQVEPTSTFAAPFVGNHDLPRLATDLGGDPSLLQSRLKLAAVAFLSLPGSAVVYYGDEIGLPEGTASASPGDLGKRTPMQWDGSAGRGFSSAKPWLAPSSADPSLSVQEQQKDPESLWHTYQSLIGLRAHFAELAQGEISYLAEPASGIVSYELTLPGSSNRVVVVLNFSEADANSLNIPFDGGSSVSDLYGSAAVGLADGDLSVSLPRLSAAVFLVQ